MVFNSINYYVRLLIKLFIFIFFLAWLISHYWFLHRSVTCLFTANVHVFLLYCLDLYLKIHPSRPSTYLLTAFTLSFSSSSGYLWIHSKCSCLFFCFSLTFTSKSTWVAPAYTYKLLSHYFFLHRSGTYQFTANVHVFLFSCNSLTFT